MDVIERYLEAVAAQLSVEDREDIVAELRDLILSRVEAREEELGRALVIVKVQKDGPCSSAGILPGDVLLMAGGNKVDGVEKLERLLPSSGKLTVTVRRNQENRKVDLQF